jgi:hypothetical protein
MQPSGNYYRRRTQNWNHREAYVNEKHISEIKEVIMEKYSKKKKGRPTSWIMNHSKKFNLNDGCNRSQMNAGYVSICLESLGNSGEQIAINERGNFRRGFKTMAVEAGRYIKETDNCNLENVGKFIVVSLENDMTFREIGFYFRGLRLGEKAGNVEALKKELIRNIDVFWKTFPKTSKFDIVNAIQQVEHKILTIEIDEVI